jgi:hypothetical protein
VVSLLCITAGVNSLLCITLLPCYPATLLPCPSHGSEGAARQQGSRVADRFCKTAPGNTMLLVLLLYYYYYYYINNSNHNNANIRSNCANRFTILAHDGMVLWIGNPISPREKQVGGDTSYQPGCQSTPAPRTTRCMTCEMPPRTQDGARAPSTTQQHIPPHKKLTKVDRVPPNRKPSGRVAASLPPPSPRLAPRFHPKTALCTARLCGQGAFHPDQLPSRAWIR